ncbi:hypothetical protein FRC17_000713 [Serendipita sp. 399]|nr:hypothetical protein FRC17_000713 [Serendipita sp. 399]
MYRSFAYSILCLLVLPSFTLAGVILEKGASGGGGGGGRGGGGGGRGGGTGSSGAGRGLSGGTGRPAITFPGIDTGGRSANYFSGGGGKPFIIHSPSRFSGREMGGGSRSDVVGTRSYGSGYPHSSVRGVAGQPFPFGFWPMYWGGHGQSDEYGGNSDLDQDRPGGNQVIVQLAPNTTIISYNVSAVNGIDETYWMIGDRESVTTLLSILVDVKDGKKYPYGCGVLNNTILPFDSTNSTIHFSNVIQWYRSSSFALAYEGYNNSFAFPPLNETSGVGWNASTPLPEQQLYSPFLHCLNSTITTALPILDGPRPKYSKADIVGIVLGSLIGAICAVFCCVIPCVKEIRHRIKNKNKSNNNDYSRYTTFAATRGRKPAPQPLPTEISTDKCSPRPFLIPVPTIEEYHRRSVASLTGSTRTLVGPPAPSFIHEPRDGNPSWQRFDEAPSSFDWSGREKKY